MEKETYKEMLNYATFFLPNKEIKFLLQMTIYKE